MSVSIERWTVLGAPWFNSKRRDAETKTVEEPDIGVNCHTPIELLPVRGERKVGTSHKHLNVTALLKRAQEEK